MRFTAGGVGAIMVKVANKQRRCRGKEVNMNETQIAVRAAEDLVDILKRVSQQQVDALVQQMVEAKRIYVAGAGRSLLMLRGFAMRLMHVGLTCHVVGDVTTPAFTPQDLLLVGSGSGETESLVGIAKKAKQLGGKLAVLTIFPNSTLAQMANTLVHIPAYTDKMPESETNKPTTLPGGSSFEEALLLLADAVIVPMARAAGLPEGELFHLHANLE